MSYNTSLKLYYTAPCEALFAFGTADRAEDCAFWHVQFVLFEDTTSSSQRTVMLGTLVDQGHGVILLALEITASSVASLQILGSTTLSMRMDHTGLFLSFPMPTMVEDFHEILQKWFRTDTTDRSGHDSGERPMAQSPGAEPVMNTRVQTLSIVEFILASLEAVEEARLEEDAEFISGTPEELEIGSMLAEHDRA